MRAMLPSRPHTFKLSKAAIGLVTATLLLGAILAVNTLRNIGREQRLMENFLLREGLTVIRAFEAGARTSLRHMPMMAANGDDPLATLAAETAAEEDVAYIRIADEHGTILAEAGNPPPLEAGTIGQVLAARRPRAALVAGGRFFEVARPFEPLRGSPPQMRAMRQRWRQWCQASSRNCEPATAARRMVIFVGLPTDEFLAIQRQDLRHALVMGGVLFLVGTAGLYFVFLYQEVHVARATLADMEQYTTNVIHSMPAGLITLDPAGRLVSCNPQAVDILGPEINAASGQPVAQALSFWPQELADPQSEVRNLAVEWPRPDGETVPVKIHASRLRGRDGGDVGQVIIIQDMRQIREMEERLERSRRLAALGRVAAGVAHEIRNPLGTLRGFAQYFATRATDEASREYAGLMIGEVDRLNQTVSALLQFARPREPSLQPVVLRQLLDRARLLLDADLNAAGVGCDIECPEGIRLLADPDLLLQVLINCVKNSIAASREGDTVLLRGTASGGNVTIAIHDHGCGMTEEERKRMFDPFYTTRPDGTGLGLAVSHQIVEQHGGRFEVRTQVGKGTVIMIVLPRGQEDGAATGPEP